jgi:hypothetical protein
MQTCVVHLLILVMHLRFRTVSALKKIYLNINILHCVLYKITFISQLNTFITGLSEKADE